jgi:Flp pilus assembly protein TadD
VFITASVKNGGDLASITAVICRQKRMGSIISEQMRSLSKTACGFLSLILATSMSAASPAPAGPKKKTKKTPAATIQHAEIIQAPHSDILSVTTSSSEARGLYEAGIHTWEVLQIDSALKRWRIAINVDPHFALAHLLLSYCTPDPVEEQVERQKAKSLGNDVTPGERLLITWLSGVRENDYLSGIIAMNELLQQYPKDKQLLLWAGSWLFHEKEYELAQKRLEEAVAIDADFAPALNDLSYVYAYQGDYKQALGVMQHYVELLPNEPNPQDSYAEMLRMAGRYDDALEHYRAALGIDPNFHSSQLGIADTYSLMGQQKKARREYFNARVLATDKATELEDVLQSAFTYVRDRDSLGADQAFEGVAQQAHRAAVPVIEAEAWRMRARLQFIATSADLVGIDSSHAGKHFALIHRKHLQRPEVEYLARADQVLKEAKAISESDRQEEYALVLRERAEAAGSRGLFAEADAAVAQLDAMASDSPSSAIQHALNGAKGAVLVYEGNYDQAVALLERDNENAFSLFRLAYAGQKNGGGQVAQAPLATTRAFKEPTPEQAFFAPAVELASASKAEHLTTGRE